MIYEVATPQQRQQVREELCSWASDITHDLLKLRQKGLGCEAALEKIFMEKLPDHVIDAIIIAS